MAPSPEESPNQDSPPPPPPPDSSSDDSSPPPSSPSPPPPKSSSSSPPPPPPSSDNNDSPSRPSPPAPKGGGGGGKDDSPSTPAPKSGGGNKNNPPTSKDSSSGGPDVKVIVGVAVAAGILLLIMIILLSRCLSKRKKRRNQQMQYYPSHQPNKGGSDQYYNSSQSPPWLNNSQGGEHIVKVPPPPPGGGSWGAAPPMQMQSQPHYSGGDSSSNFSGPFRPPPLPPPSPGIALGFNKSTFTYEELAAATNGFSQVNLLGQGGFGYVHKGILPNGKEVAVKSLKSGSGQGEREFSAEVEIISRVHHRHLVSLVGYCIAEGQRMLVYEFVTNKTLEHHLHGKNLPVMDFSTRLRIALGSAKGLAYLHEDCHPRIIHRDIKAANILLDFNFEAMVADFGLAKLSSDNYTHVSTRVMGTFGPVDPTSTMEDSLVDWARPLLARALEDGNVDQLADARLEGNFSHHEMQRMVACAAASIRHSARKRPKMSQIVRALEGDSSLDDLNEGGVKPGQSHIYNNSGMMSSDYSASNYQADMARFRQLALSSQEFPSNEFGGTGTSTSSGDHSSEMTTPPGMRKHNI
ncbi:hypothetical protein CCACVL1_26195 [Corchorus capsularis]|uniref:non-specific serine/threonine protein kinase n=1 Tax=Corchorus capsularis TaxID=210143 RepID=A0A1R3GFM4_COCAP|nr:hypothetical protein CCACVL1_26195 [Corchorus capsularis]